MISGPAAVFPGLTIDNATQNIVCYLPYEVGFVLKVVHSLEIPLF